MTDTEQEVKSLREAINRVRDALVVIDREFETDFTGQESSDSNKDKIRHALQHPDTSRNRDRDVARIVEMLDAARKVTVAGKRVEDSGALSIERKKIEKYELEIFERWQLYRVWLNRMIRWGGGIFATVVLYSILLNSSESENPWLNWIKVPVLDTIHRLIEAIPMN